MRCLRYLLHMKPIEAMDTATDLRNILEELAELDTSPIHNAARIEVLRREALSCSTLLSGYLVASPNFAGVA